MAQLHEMTSPIEFKIWRLKSVGTTGASNLLNLDHIMKDTFRHTR